MWDHPRASHAVNPWCYRLSYMMLCSNGDVRVDAGYSPDGCAQSVPTGPRRPGCLDRGAQPGTQQAAFVSTDNVIFMLPTRGCGSPHIYGTARCAQTASGRPAAGETDSNNLPLPTSGHVHCSLMVDLYVSGSTILQQLLATDSLWPATGLQAAFATKSSLQTLSLSIQPSILRVLVGALRWPLALLLMTRASRASAAVSIKRLRPERALLVANPPQV